MKQQNMILTSVLALVIASPSMAAVGDVITTGAQCTIGDLGVSSGTANATAQYSINSYTCAAGTYLPAGNGWSTDTQYTDNNCATCPANSYCPGSGNAQFTYSASNNQGITACSGTYTLSDTNSTSADSWYRECTTSDVAHSAAVTGRYYAGGATPNQCAPASTNGCVTGYHYVAAAAAPTLPAANAGPNYGSVRAKSYYTDEYGIQYCNYDDGCMDESEYTSSQLAEYNDLSNGEWKISWTSGATQGTMHGIASCNSTAGDNGNGNYNNDSSNWLRSGDTFNSESTGQYCWCKPTSWTPSGGGEQSLAAGWVLSADDVDADDCARDCAAGCALDVNDRTGFRAAVLGSISNSPTPAQCVANNITLSWNNENGTQFTSGSCTYDESLTVPSTHPDKRGYTFTGWQFVSPSQN